MSESKKKSDNESDTEESSHSNDADKNSSEEDDFSDHSVDSKDEIDHSSRINVGVLKKEGDPYGEKKHHSVTFVCTALSDYSAKEAGELSFEKDEMLTVTNIREDGWWEAKNSDEMQGLVPSTFLKVPDHMNEIINEMLQSGNSKEIRFWSNLRSSLRKAQAFNTVIRTFGSIGFPLGFHECMLGSLLIEDCSYNTEAFLKPRLNESGLSFEDLQWENSEKSDNKMSMQLKPITTVLQKVIQLVALRQITPPPSGYDVTSRHVHMCLHDGNKVLSNIHTVKASWDMKNPKIWMFGSKIAVEGSCSEEGLIFIRCNKSLATLGILFELCVTYKKVESSEILEMSCGWAFMRLLNDSGLPIKSKTKILKIHNSVPFTNYLDGSVSLNSLQKLMNRSKQPRMVISISSPKRSSTQQISYLPSTIIGPVSNIPLMALYRKIIANDLLERASFDSAEVILSPFLSNFPRVFDQPDLIDFFRRVWSDRLKHDKHHDLRSENKKLNAFYSLFMDTVFLIMNSCDFPPYYLGNLVNEQERKSKLLKIASLMNMKDSKFLALSPDISYKPISVSSLCASIT